MVSYCPLTCYIDMEKRKTEGNLFHGSPPYFADSVPHRGKITCLWIGGLVIPLNSASKQTTFVFLIAGISNWKSVSWHSLQESVALQLSVKRVTPYFNVCMKSQKCISGLLANVYTLTCTLRHPVYKEERKKKIPYNILLAFVCVSLTSMDAMGLLFMDCSTDSLVYINQREIALHLRT